MVEPKDLSIKDLKGMHRATVERYECAKNNVVKGEASIILSILDEEFDRRGYDVSKLFKGYDPKARYSNNAEESKNLGEGEDMIFLTEEEAEERWKEILGDDYEALDGEDESPEAE
jgi:hypothetical protein